MEIAYRSKKLEIECTNYGHSLKVHGQNMAIKIAQRIEEIRAADSVDMLIRHKIGRCHRLKGKRCDEYSMDLVHPFRLIFVDEGQTALIKIIKIEDYH